MKKEDYAEELNTLLDVDVDWTRMKLEDLKVLHERLKEVFEELNTLRKLARDIKERPLLTVLKYMAPVVEKAEKPLELRKRVRDWVTVFVGGEEGGRRGK